MAKKVAARSDLCCYGDNVKRFNAIFCVLLVVWLQAVVAVSETKSGATEGASCCCTCGLPACCVVPTTPGVPVTPPAAVQVTPQNLVSFCPGTAPLWILPDAAAPVFLPPAPTSLSATVVPFFTQHCARLI